MGRSYLPPGTGFSYGLRGLVFWAVGYEDARQWPALRAYAIHQPTALSAAAPPAVTYATKATVTGTLTTASGTAVGGHQVTLQWQPTGAATWQGVASGTTSATGAVALGYTPTVNGSFRADAAGVVVLPGRRQRSGGHPGALALLHLAIVVFGVLHWSP